MKTTTACRFVVAIPLLCFINHPVVAISAESEAQTVINLAGVIAPKPETWQAVTPSSSMRLAQFKVPAARSGVGDAECIVFYFGPGQGGTAEANIARWQSQFSAPSGEAVKPSVQTFDVNGMTVTEVELSGNYARGVGTGPVGEAKPHQTLLAAIVEGSQGKLFVQLYGPTQTVHEHRAVFDRFVRGMRRAGQ